MTKSVKLLTGVLVAFSAFLFTVSIQAQGPMPHFRFQRANTYWGAGLHSMYVNLDPENSESSKYILTGLRLTGGTVINEIFSIEAQVAFFGEDDGEGIYAGTIGNVNGELDYHLALLGKFNIFRSDVSTFFLTLGGQTTEITWKPESALKLAGASKKTDSFSGLAVGFGGNYKITPTTKISLDFNLHATDASSDFWGNNVDLYNLTLGISQLF